MPHAENNAGAKTNGTKASPNGVMDSMTNGEKSNSEFLSHLASYPMVSDGIHTFKENPYGAKSLSMAHQAYASLLAPITVYFKGPYAYVAPYLTKADSMGVRGLEGLEARFPVVKQEMSTVKQRVHSTAMMPLTIATNGKDYVFRTYDSEFQRTHGQGVMRQAKAAISTELKIAIDVLNWISEALRHKKEEGAKLVDEKMNH